MNNLKKSLLILLALMAFATSAWAQNSITVNNETDLRTALSSNSIVYINVNGDNIDVTSSDDLLVSSNKVIILVGCNITCTNARFRVVSGGSLVIQSEYDNQIIGHGNFNGRAIYIESGGSCILQSGTVTAANNSVTNGGVIYNEGTLEIEGGTVSSGKATNGGGIYNTGTFTMGGGTIIGGSATSGGAIYNTGTVTINEGTIGSTSSPNTATAKGGGIYSTGTLTMSGGSVSGNEAGNGAGINLEGGTFTMTGGTISGNSTTDSGANKKCGGVNISGNSTSHSTMTMSGGSIADNISLDDDGGVYIYNGCTFNMTGGSITGNSAAANYGGIRVDGVFNMSGGSISGNTATDSFGGIGVDGSGTLNLTGGSITGNNATNNYGGIWINGTLNMSGNPIVSGNLAANSTASNVYLRSGKTITVNGAFTEGANIHVTHAQGLDGEGFRDFATGYATHNASTAPSTVFRSDNAAYEVGLHSSTGAASLIAATHLYDVPYLNVDETGDHGMATRATCTMMSSIADNNPTLNSTYWYVVDQDKTFGRITISGEVNIILADNTILRAQNCVYVPNGASLHIWAQSTNYSATGGDNMGALFADSQEGGYSCIGGHGEVGHAGYLFFHGGYILAGDLEHSPTNSAGISGATVIGKGQYGTYIYGGAITALGGENAAGIGSHEYGMCGGIKITGGTVYAQGGLEAAGIGTGRFGTMHERSSGYSALPVNDLLTEIRITGGNISAWGTNGAGIGGGLRRDTYEGDAANVIIEGGTVLANTMNSDLAGLSDQLTHYAGAQAIGNGAVQSSTTWCSTQTVKPQISDNHKVSATTDINGTPSLITRSTWAGDSWATYKRILIEPCDHPGQVSTNYTDNNGNLRIVCDHCYSTVPYALVFEGDWNENNSWRGQIQPQAGSDVEVNVPATIPSGCIANVGNIDMQEGGSLTIADGGQLIHSNAGVTATVQKSINAYTVSQNHDDVLTNGWYFIASPLTDAYTPAGNMIANTYDLYRLNPTSGRWENFKNQEGHPDFTTLNNGTGYLYANSVQTTLGFTGELKPYSEADGANQVGLSAGWNLVGNPFACNVCANQPFYKMNDALTGLSAELPATTTIAPCEGIIIDAASVGTVSFTQPSQASAAPSHGSLQIALSQEATERGTEGRGPSTGSGTLALDNAIVSFDEGSQLGKFYFGEQNANIYLPQGDKEYAIAYSDKQGEMPLNFKATKNGTYTISVNPENVEMSYLHLIDNMTGADVDLLAHSVPEPVEGPTLNDGVSTSSTTSYTFNANVTDYESRFKLVFASKDENGPSTGSGTFAFFSDGNIIVNGEGMLQVIDVTGRVIRCTDVARNVSTGGMTAGVYVLRLINGENVKVQKIVVR